MRKFKKGNIEVHVYDDKRLSKLQIARYIADQPAGFDSVPREGLEERLETIFGSKDWEEVLDGEYAKGRCPRCGLLLGSLEYVDSAENWLVLGGKCPDCNNIIRIKGEFTEVKEV